MKKAPTINLPQFKVKEHLNTMEGSAFFHTKRVCSSISKL